MLRADRAVLLPEVHPIREGVQCFGFFALPERGDGAVDKLESGVALLNDRYGGEGGQLFARPDHAHDSAIEDLHDLGDAARIGGVGVRLRVVEDKQVGPDRLASRRRVNHAAESARTNWSDGDSCARCQRTGDNGEAQHVRLADERRRLSHVRLVAGLSAVAGGVTERGDDLWIIFGEDGILEQRLSNAFNQ